MKFKQLKEKIKAMSDAQCEKFYFQNPGEKTLLLFKMLRDQTDGDIKMMKKLQVNSNAFYALRSRLGSKIEEYLKAS